MDRKRPLLILFLASGWVLLIIILIFHHQIVNLYDRDSFENQEKEYPLLSKRILQEFPQDVLVNFLGLRTDLKNQVEPYGEDFGFYFEYLPTGTSIGINSEDDFYAASLF